jgi:predicted polyphosphate/ATP-dependent NAD kinase
MSGVGIIANPASGKDIRRLVAHGSVFDNHEKANIVRRVLLGLDAVGVERAWIMPDAFGIGLRALDGLRLKGLDAQVLEMPVTLSSADTPCATRHMLDLGIRCIVTLGGDGTNRLVAQVSREATLMPISTGTNNVFPSMVEGTLAGMAAGLVARGLVADAVERMVCLEISSDQGISEVALVDVAAYAERFVGARAVWDPARILELVLARVEPGSIGLSSIGAHLGLELAERTGLHLRMGAGGQRVLAPIAPGLIAQVDVAAHRILQPGDEVRLCYTESCTLALDGERETVLSPATEVSIKLNPDGPRVIDVRRAMAAAARTGTFALGTGVRSAYGE